MADGNVGRVNVELGLDDKNLKRGIKEAVQSLEKIGDTAEAVGRDAEASFDKATTATKEFGAKGVRVADDLSNSYLGLEAKIKGVESATERYAREMSALNSASAVATRNFAQLGSKLQATGQKLSLGLTLPVVGASAAAIKLANDFEFSMASITGLVGVAAEEVQAMKGDVRSMAMEFGRSAPEAAEALYFVASAGITGSNAMAVLEQSLKASAVGLGETMIIADTVSSALNAYGSANLTASEATDALVAAVREGKMEADQLAGALPRVLPIASAMGVSFEEVSAAFAAMSRNGTDANEAATQIRGILSSLLNPAKQAEQQLNDLGLSGSFLRETIREQGLLAGLELLTEAFGNNEEAAGVVFGNIRALTGVMSLFGEATASTETIFANLTDNTGDLDKAFSAMSSTGAFQVRQAMASLKDAMISLGQALVPIVLPILEKITSVLSTVARGFTSLPGPIKTVIVVMGGLAAATGPVLIAIGGMMKAFAALKIAMATTAGTAGMGAFKTGLATILPLLKNPAFLGASAVAVGVGMAFKAMSDRAQEAKERQERLTETLRSAGDPTLALVDAVNALGDAYANAAENAPALDDAVSTAQGRFVGAELAASGLDTVVSTLGISIEDIATQTQTGTDAFDDLRVALKNNGNGLNGVIDILNKYSDVPFVPAILEAVEAQDLSAIAASQLVTQLDALADASDDAREAMNAEAQQALTSGSSYDYLASVIGTDYLVALRDTALAQAEAEGSATPYADALAVVKDAVDRVIYVQSRLDATTAEVSSQAKVATTSLEGLDDVMNRLRGSSEEGALSFAQVANELGLLGDVLANELQLMLLDTQDYAVGMFSDLADGETTLIDLERSVRTAAKQIGELVVNTNALGGQTSDAIPAIVQIMRALYDGAEAAGFSKARVTDLIREIGFLDQLSPEIALALTLDTATIEKQIQVLVNQLKATGGRSGAIMAQIDELGALLRAVREAETVRPPSGGGGGGGGGAPKEEDPFAWVEDWVADLAKFTEDVLSRDFTDRLVSSTAPEIADALAEVLNEAMKLAVNILPGGEGLEALINSTSEALQGLANQLEDTGDEIEPIAGLRSQFRDAVAEVRRMEDAVADLEDRFREFNRVEVEGRLNASELLDIGLDKYDQLKSQLASLRSAYSDFTAVENPLDTQLGVYQEASDAVANLRTELEELDRMMSGPSALELERTRLDNMASSLEGLRSAQADFAKSTAESLGSVPFGKRGGALFQAKRYLGKVEAFRDVLAGLRDRAFPVEIIREVLSAGIDGGTALGKKLLSLGDADLSELKRIQETIGQVTGQIGTIASDVLFTAEVSEAEAAFDRQMSLVRTMYATALADAEANFASQKAITQGLYEQQIAQAELALEQQKVVVQGLFQSAIAEAKKNLEDARSVARELQTALQGVEGAMRDLIKTLMDFIASATRPATGTTGSGGGVSGGNTVAPIGANIPGTNIPIVIGTGDTGVPKTGDKVGGQDRLWGGGGGGAVVDGIYIGPEVKFRAKGGPVGAGSPYMVGELGPELFVPRSAGTIVPNDAMARAGGTNNYTINVNVAPGQDVGRQVVRAIEEYERRNGNGWRS